MQEEKQAEKSSWIKTKPAELESLIIDLAKKGNSPAKIGLVLRDQHGIPKSKLLGLKITKVLKKADVPYTTDKQIIEKKIETLKEHIKKSKKDKTASKSLEKRLWQVKTPN